MSGGAGYRYGSPGACQLSTGRVMVSGDAATAVAAAHASTVAECAFLAADGRVRIEAVTPLVADDRITVALPFARRDLADELAAAADAVIVCSDARGGLRGWQPAAAGGRFRVEADPDGVEFAGALLDEELRKHPPSRKLVDSLMARREHWWYMGRLIARLEIDRSWSVAARSSPDEAVLAWRTGDGRLDVAAVGASSWSGDRVRVRPCGDPAHRPAPAGAVACLFRHDYSVPDRERQVALRLSGRLDGDELVVSDREGSVSLPDPPGLWARWRRHRALARACRRELARADG
jgi:hypothetical protein